MRYDIYIPPLPRGTVRQNFRSCLHRPWKTNEISFLPQPALENRMTPPCLHRPRGSKTKILLASTSQGKQSKISSLPQPAKGKQSKICSRGSSELIGPDRVSTSSRPPAKSGPKFACTSVASSPGSEQCANFPPSTLQRLLQGSNEPSVSAKVGKLKVSRVVPSVSLLARRPLDCPNFPGDRRASGFRARRLRYRPGVLPLCGKTLFCGLK